MTAESKSPGKACLGGILGIMISLTYSGCFSVEEPVSVQDGAGRDWQSEVEKELVISGLREGDPWSLAHLHLALPEESELQNSRDQLTSFFLILILLFLSMVIMANGESSILISY